MRGRTAGEDVSVEEARAGYAGARQSASNDDQNVFTLKPKKNVVPA